MHGYRTWLDKRKLHRAHQAWRTLSSRRLGPAFKARAQMALLAYSNARSEPRVATSTDDQGSGRQFSAVPRQNARAPRSPQASHTTLTQLQLSEIQDRRASDTIGTRLVFSDQDTHAATGADEDPVWSGTVMGLTGVPVTPTKTTTGATGSMRTTPKQQERAAHTDFSRENHVLAGARRALAVYANAQGGQPTNTHMNSANQALQRARNLLNGISDQSRQQQQQQQQSRSSHDQSSQHHGSRSRQQHQTSQRSTQRRKSGGSSRQTCGDDSSAMAGGSGAGCPKSRTASRNQRPSAQREPRRVATDIEQRILQRRQLRRYIMSPPTTSSRPTRQQVHERLETSKREAETAMRPLTLGERPEKLRKKSLEKPAETPSAPPLTPVSPYRLAAICIQAMCRGWSARLLLVRCMAAATRIQSVQRGQQTRHVKQSPRLQPATDSVDSRHGAQQTYRQAEAVEGRVSETFGAASTWFENSNQDRKQRMAGGLNSASFRCFR